MVQAKRCLQYLGATRGNKLVLGGCWGSDVAGRDGMRALVYSNADFAVLTRGRVSPGTCWCSEARRLLGRDDDSQL
jgi:hypothetical protein